MSVRVFLHEREATTDYLVRVGGYTVEEFLDLAGQDDRWEYVDGEIIMHSPAKPKHERRQSFLCTLLTAYVDRLELGEVFPANTLLHLATCRKVAADVLFLSAARAGQEAEGWIEAPVDLVVEITSKSTDHYDRTQKLELYKEAKTDEIWIVRPQAAEIKVAFRHGRGYRETAIREGILRSRAVRGFFVRAEWLLADRPPRHCEALAEVLGG